MRATTSSKPRQPAHRPQLAGSSWANFLLGLAICCSLLLSSAADNGAQQPAGSSEQQELSKRLPPNHRMEPLGEEGAEPGEPRAAAPPRQLAGRQGRQYDGPMGAPSSGSYAALASDAGAYVGAQVPLGGGSGYSGAGSGAGTAGYAGELASGAYSPANGYHADAIGRGYPAPVHSAYPSAAPFGLSSMMGPAATSGLLSPGGPTWPLLAKGFDVSEIICTAIAVAIGAVIVGAPFILLYLFVMNQMGANGPGGMGASGGAISLTGPSSSTTVNGRKKRQTSFSEALFKQLGPLVNNEQLANSFKVLMSAISKYQM